MSQDKIDYTVPAGNVCVTATRQALSDAIIALHGVPDFIIDKVKFDPDGSGGYDYKVWAVDGRMASYNATFTTAPEYTYSGSTNDDRFHRSFYQQAGSLLQVLMNAVHSGHIESFDYKWTP